MYATEVTDVHCPDYDEKIFSSFRTFETRDYSALTTFEGRRPVIDLCASHQDQKMCVIEKVRPQMSDYMIQASTQLKIVEIGRLKDNEDENDEEEDEQREDHDEDEDSDESGDGDDDEEIGGNSSDRESVFRTLGRVSLVFFSKFSQRWSTVSRKIQKKTIPHFPLNIGIIILNKLQNWKKNLNVLGKHI